MKQKWKRRFCAAAAAFWLAGCTVPVWADSLEDQRDAYVKQANEKREKSNAMQTKIQNFSEEKRMVDEAADKAVADYKVVKDKLDETQSRMDANKAKLDQLETDYQKKSGLLGKRVRDIYINGQISYIDVLFGAKDFSDFLTRMDLLKRVIQQDYRLVETVLEDKHGIEKSQQALEKDRADEAVQVRDKESKKNDMLAKQKVKEKIIEKMKYDKETIDREYNELMAASKQVGQMVRSSQYQVSGGLPSGAGNGSMIWPISGPITSEFGWRIHPITGDSRFHSGLDIGGDYGMAVHAAAAGTVTYAGWISGYGNAVIIDHGGGITTLYGHNQSLNVSEGQSVAQGQVIAACGSTGNSTGPHCHFEVRQNGEPVSPYGYL